MAHPFGFLIAPLIIALMASPSLSLSSQPRLKLEIPTTISAAPAILPTPPPSPYKELSPDIIPLLPSPGGKVPSSTISSVPTIPSNPSPPNPDETVVFGPESAFSPFGSLPVSAAMPVNVSRSLNFGVFVGVLGWWSVVVLGM
ncbi:hypothetical protein LguiB_025699 [Lonicera macranthoides]